MHATRAVAALALAMLAAPAAAQVPNAPTQDFAIAYRMTGGGNTIAMRVFHSASLNRQRIEPEGEAARGGIMLIDMAARRTVMLDPARRTAMEMPPGLFDAPGGMLFDLSDVQLTRTGTDRVAGHACTTFRVARAGSPVGTSCVTESGIVLRVASADPARPGGMEATEVTIAPQPASRFEVPEGYQRMQLPMGAPPGGPPGAPPQGRRP